MENYNIIWKCRGYFKMIKSVTFILLYILPFTIHADPQQTRITAKKEIVYDQEKLVVSAYQKAKVEKGTDTLEADEIHANLEKKDNNKTNIKYVWAKGNVRITMPDKIAKGDYGTYDLDKDLITLEGHVTIIEKQNEITGDYAETNRKTGITRMVNKKSGAVKALLISTSKSK